MPSVCEATGSILSTSKMSSNDIKVRGLVSNITFLKSRDEMALQLGALAILTEAYTVKTYTVQFTAASNHQSTHPPECQPPPAGLTPGLKNEGSW